METTEDSFTKQYDNKEILYENLTKRNVNLCSRPRNETYHLLQPYFKPNFNHARCEEPIDLTQGPPRIVKQENNPTFFEHPQYFIKPRARRTKIFTQNTFFDQNQLQGFFKDVIELQATENKQAEILKAAKSLFSKRTRTLYHWMYPNTPKQQIKLAVANSWENLGGEEKQFYISQVLVRFGFPQCNLMVNPQLGGIKELPPLPDALEPNSSVRELQTAISSISGLDPNSRPEGKRRQGRPPGSKNKKIRGEGVSTKISKDFQDDPELSKELEKFAISFDCFK